MQFLFYFFVKFYTFVTALCEPSLMHHQEAAHHHSRHTREQTTTGIGTENMDKLQIKSLPYLTLLIVVN